MPSSYSPPDVVVQQIQRTVTRPRLTPVLTLVIVAPARQIVSRLSAGQYEATEEFQARLPDLTEGAVVNAASVQVLLDAEDASGNPIGTFLLNMDGTDGEILPDGENIRILSTLLIEYSTLSSRNNNQSDSLTDDDRASGEPDGLFFTDEDVDFLGRGAVLDGESFVVIDSPQSMAGRYRITDFLPTGQLVKTVRVLKVDEDNIADVQKVVTINAAALPVSRFVYGFGATHQLGTVAGGSHISNAVAPGDGIGVTALLEIDTGITSINGASLTSLLTPGTIDIPAQTSGDAVWFTPGDPGNPSILTGINLPLWRKVFEATQIGDWVRFTGDFGSGTVELRDYKIVDMDAADYEIRLQNSDFGGSGTFTLDLGAVSWPDITSIQFLRVARGRQDQANAAGDFLTGVAQNVPFQIEILKAIPGYIELAEELPPLSGIVNTVCSLERGIPFRNAEASYDLRRRIASGFSGDVLVSYTAQRLDLPLDGLIDIGDQSDIESKLGTIHPNNPLALMADIAARSGLTSGGRVFFALATTGDTLADYNAALETLKIDETYYIVPATQDPAILSAFKSHVLAQSEPEQKHERFLIASTALPISDLIVPPVTTDPIPTGTISGGIPARLTLTANDANLGRMQPGMVVKILASGAIDAAIVETHRIRDVNLGAGYATMLDDFTSTGTVYFRVDTYPRTKLQQAEAWRDEAKAYASKRCMLVRPAECEITYTDKTGPTPVDLDIRVPAYYACAAVAGQSAMLPASQPMTNAPIPGINKVFYSSEYFTPDQLNTIAEGGNCILFQPTRNVSPTIRHQLTTDPTSLETQEFSITKAVDFSAYYFRNSLRQFIGKHNITREVLTQLRGVSEGILKSLIGGGIMLPGTRLEALYQDPDQLDSVVVEVGLVVPYPLNRITVKLYI